MFLDAEWTSANWNAIKISLIIFVTDWQSLCHEEFLEWVLKNQKNINQEIKECKFLINTG